MIVNLAAMPHLVVLMAIGAGLGLERSLDGGDARAELARKLLEHVVRGDTQEAGADLQRHVAVAEVVGDARELARFDVQQFLRRGDDLDLASVGRGDPVAAAQHAAARQNERDLLAALRLHPQPAFLALLEWQGQFQNRKYLCAMGRVFAGSQTSSSPSARTS